MTFESLNIHPSIKKGLEDVQISEAKNIHKELLDLFHVQVPALIKSSNSSLDELLLPLLHYIAESNEKQFKSNRIGILCPTANFAIDVEQWIWAVGYHAKIRCSRVTQREDKAIQQQALKSHPSVVIGDPGRLLDFISDGIWQLGQLDMLVIFGADELDRYKQFNKVKKIAKSVESDTQIYVQAQVFNSTVESLLAFMPVHTKCIGFDAIENTVGPAFALNKRVHNQYYEVPDRLKISTLMSHLEESKNQRILVSAYSRKTTQRLFKIIRKKNWGVVSIESSLSEDLRSERLNNYYNKDYRILLLSGLSVEDLKLHGIGEVILYDIPDDIFEIVRYMQLLDYGYKKQVVSLLYQADLEAYLRVSAGIGLEPSKRTLPERKYRFQSDVPAKSNKKNMVKASEKNSRKKNPKSKNSTNNSATYKSVEIPRVNLEELENKKKLRKPSKSKNAMIKPEQGSDKTLNENKTGSLKPKASENPVKRFFKRLF